jgi:nuclear transport factor 2 (NTF2) superfamily protein
MTVQQWVDAYAQAWRDRDPEAAAALFTEDGLYRSHPLHESHQGAEGVRAYWADVTSTQDSVDGRMGRPVEAADGRRAAVEFWVRLLSSGAEATLVGILFLRFGEDGRCEDLRETWMFEPGDHPPHDGWGT